MHHKKELLAAGKKISWYPSSMFLRYKHWIAGLQWDWCISRQRHFGVPFPVWYERATGKVIVASVDELPIDPLTSVPRHYTGDPQNLVAEADVMDTWATSSVSPQLALGWHAQDPLFSRLFPMDLRPQAHDIIRTWAFYTIVKSQYMHGTIPWKAITISGHLQDSRGRKMSKSLGNVVDPREVLSTYGADCFRFMAASSKLGEDLPFQEKDLVTGGKTVTKLWNAARFAFLHLATYSPQKKVECIHPLDAWLFAHMHTTIKDATDAFLAHEYSKARSAIDSFFWHTFCDNYLEFVKHRLYTESAVDTQARLSAQYTLYQALFVCIKLYAPFMPFITEEIYHRFFLRFEQTKSIHISLWPIFEKQLVQKRFMVLGDLFCQTIAFVRSQKSARQLSLKAPVATLVCDKKLLVLQKDLVAVTHAQQVRAGPQEVIF
jgi:valyl-tRNA synthetase